LSGAITYNNFGSLTVELIGGDERTWQNELGPNSTIVRVYSSTDPPPLYHVFGSDPITGAAVDYETNTLPRPPAPVQEYYDWLHDESNFGSELDNLRNGAPNSAQPGFWGGVGRWLWGTASDAYSSAMQVPHMAVDLLKTVNYGIQSARGNTPARQPVYWSTVAQRAGAAPRDQAG
jgi:hypothetical protein